LTASNAAVISIRWFVVRASAPDANAPSGTAQAHPPGPGFPLQAPSVYTTVDSGTRVSMAAPRVGALTS
jgi:hypothetical protein